MYEAEEEQFVSLINYSEAPLPYTLGFQGGS